MKIVRTIGQAFDVCHKISTDKQQSQEHDEQNVATSDKNTMEPETSNVDLVSVERTDLGITKPRGMVLASFLN